MYFFSLFAFFYIFLSLFYLFCPLAIELSTMHDHTHQYPLPCLYCHPHSYIRMVILIYYIIIYMLHTLLQFTLKNIIIIWYVFPCFQYHNNLQNFHAWKMQVQNLIERCMIFHMNQDQCIKALEEHAGIQPLVTLTGLDYSLFITLEIYVIL